MSDMENWTGKLVPINIDVSNIELWLKNHYTHEGVELPKYYDSYEEFARDGNDDILIHNDKLYRCVDFSNANSNIASRNAEGSIDFAVEFYNGGCGRDEAICDVIDELIKKEAEK